MSLKDDLGGFAPLAGLIPQAIMHKSESGLMGALPELLDLGKDRDKKKAVGDTTLDISSPGAIKTGDKTLGVNGMKRGGKVKKMAKGGSVSSASKRADGCAIRGKTRGRMR